METKQIENVAYRLTSNAKWQETCRAMVQREVYYCVSTLVSELMQDPGGRYVDDLITVCLSDDWSEAAKDHARQDKTLTDVERKELLEALTDQDAARDYCDEHRIEPFTVEAFEHWIVSDWLASKLEERGEMVIRDFLGLTIWGRTCTGQAIRIDGVISDIALEAFAQDKKTQELIKQLNK